MKNKLVEHSLIAFAILLCTFFSWIFISQADIPVDLGAGERSDQEGSKSGSGIVYFANTLNTSAEEVGNYWLDEILSEGVGELPDFYTTELHITRGSEFDGDAIFINQGTNQGTINGNATFIGDLSEDSGVVSGTRTRLYNTESIAVTRDFTSEDTIWTVTADGVEVDVTKATYNENTTFTRLNGGYFISDMSVEEADLEGSIITLTYDRELNPKSIPPIEDYSVTVGGESASISEVTISGSSVTLELDQPVITDIVVLLTYTIGGNQVLSEQGLNGLSFNDLAVTVIVPQAELEEDQPQEDQPENDPVIESVEQRSGGSLPLSFFSTPQTDSKKIISKDTTNANSRVDALIKETTDIKKSDTATGNVSQQEVKTPIPPATIASPTAQKLESKVLLSVEDKGRIWYVAPTQQTRYEVSTSNALNLFRNVSLGITNKDLEKIPIAGTAAPVPPIGKRLTGRFLLQVENRGQTWFIDQSGYRHKVGIDNIVEVTKQSALGISNQDLNQIVPSN